MRRETYDPMTGEYCDRYGNWHDSIEEMAELYDEIAEAKYDSKRDEELEMRECQQMEGVV